MFYAATLTRLAFPPQWILRVAPRGGWSPIWYPPLLVGIIILSVAMSVLMFAVLVSR